ncbi:MAG TPA: heavy metal-associated domain-containing protein [Opitutaceae bacterium]
MSTITHIKLAGLRRVAAPGHLEKRFEAVPGVRSVEIDPEAECATVVHEGADTGKLLVAAANEGFQAEIAAQPPR